MQLLIVISASYVANLGIGALVQGLASELAPHIRMANGFINGQVLAVDGGVMLRK
jgi:hypothetical protein